MRVLLFNRHPFILSWKYANHHHSKYYYIKLEFLNTHNQRRWTYPCRQFKRTGSIRKVKRKGKAKNFKSSLAAAMIIIIMVVDKVTAMSKKCKLFKYVSNLCNLGNYETNICYPYLLMYACCNESCSLSTGHTRLKY